MTAVGGPWEIPVLTPRSTGEARQEVDLAHCASRFTPWALEVFSTPDLIGLMEQAADVAAQAHLPEGLVTVGTRVDVAHLAACPLGQVVTARATLTAQDGRRLTFSVVAFAGGKKLGFGVHERYIVHRTRFMQRVSDEWDRGGRRPPAG